MWHGNKEHAGYPKFKSKHDNHKSYTTNFTNGNIKTPFYSEVYGRSDGYAESCTTVFAELLQSGRKRCEGETRTAGDREK